MQIYCLIHIDLNR